MWSIALLAAVLAAPVAAYPFSELSYSSAVWYMSSPRRDVGAGAVSLDSGGVGLVVAGGCNDNPSPGPEGPYSCANSSFAVDLFVYDGSQPTVQPQILPLQVARGWPSVCSVGSQVVIAGGGTSSIKTPSADVIDVAARKVAGSYPNALSSARWGHACATLNNLVYFGGGFGPDYDTNVDVFKAAASGGAWSPAPFKLSSGRESAGAVAIPSADAVLFAGGWNDNLDNPNFATIDAFNVSTGMRSTAAGTLKMPCYWPGAANVGNFAYVIDNAYLNVIDGDGRVVSTSELPAPLAGSGPAPSEPWESGGAITDPHLPQNGVALFDCLACYYGLRQTGETTNAVFCYNTVTEQWLQPLNCTAVHKAGAIAGAGNTVFVTGGYDPVVDGNPPTNVVDVFVVAEPTECARRRPKFF